MQEGLHSPLETGMMELSYTLPINQRSTVLMDHFDLTHEPPSSKEVAAAMSDLKQQRRQLMIRSGSFDAVHLLVLLLLYFGGFLSGRAILVLVALSLVVTIVLATATRDSLLFSDLVAITISISATSVATVLLLAIAMSQPWGGSIFAGVLAGSIVTSGTILGRALKRVMLNIEQLKPISLDDPLFEELNWLCQRYPELRDYREEASHNLRPYLSYGEFFAMREWHQQQLKFKSSDNQP